MILTDEQEKVVLYATKTMEQKGYDVLDYRVFKNPERGIHNKTAATTILELEISDPDGKLSKVEFNYRKTVREMKAKEYL